MAKKQSLKGKGQKRRPNAGENRKAKRPKKASYLADILLADYIYLLNRALLTCYA